MSPRSPWHLLRSWDPLLRPCWLLRDLRTTGTLRRIVRRVAALHYHYDREIEALVLEPKAVRLVTQALEQHPEFSEWCKRCWDGDACEHWNLGTLQDEGYGLAESGLTREAATRLGLRWPWTQDQVLRAFRSRALQAHPDHGGTDHAMKELLGDRDRLLERCVREGEHGL